MNYKIIATLGPSSSRRDIWDEMVSAGATDFRLNTSHLSLNDLLAWLENLEPFIAQSEDGMRVVLDLQGSKWRLGQFAAFDLVQGQFVDLVCAASAETRDLLPVPHPDFFKAAEISNGEVVLNDAKSRLRIESVGELRLRARVELGGRISPNKGITFTACDFRKESLSEKDHAIVTQTSHLKWVSYALSYVKDGSEMEHYRQWIGSQAALAAKLERGPAMQDSARIAQSCDEVWVCRGDLGAEVGLPAMARAVAGFSEQVGTLPVPWVMAGQVLEHMTEHPTPTRSEVCYLYDTLQKGYQGFVLSDETAVGRFPVESVKTAALFRGQ